MLLRLFKTVTPMSAVDHVNAVKPVGKILHGFPSPSDTEDELFADPEELELEAESEAEAEAESEAEAEAEAEAESEAESDELDSDITF